jgi:hypothetical protein
LARARTSIGRDGVELAECSFHRTEGPRERARRFLISSALEAAAFLSERRHVTFCDGGYHHLHVDRRALLDKTLFAGTCSGQSIRVVPTIATFDRGRPTWGAGRTDEILPPLDLVSKPNDAKHGLNVRLWRRTSEGFVGSSGEVLSAEALIDRLREDSTVAPILLQPRVTNPEPLRSLANGGLCASEPTVDSPNSIRSGGMSRFPKTVRS